VDRFSEMEAFVRIVEDGSFSAAAATLRVTPSAISRLVGHLEERLDVRLVNRTTRRLSLTDEGRGFYARAARILADVDAAEQATASAGHAPHGRLRVNAPIAFGSYQIAPVLPAFLERYPGIRLELTLTDRLTDLLEEGIDVAICFGAPADSSLVLRKLGEDAWTICAAPQYLDRWGTPGTPEDLREHTCLLRTAPLADLNVWPFRGAEGAYTIRVGGRIEVNHAETLLRLALAGAGIARLARFLVAPYLAEGRLVPVLAETHRTDAVPIYAIYPHRRHLSLRVRAFVDYLAEALAAASG
jgi:DNA-binding transcriptional LysR family regulator